MKNASKLAALMKGQLKLFISDKRNLYMMAAVIMIPIAYELFRFTPLESEVTPHIFSDYPTRWLQEKLGTDSVMAYFASYYYFIPHLFITAGLVPMFLFAKRMPAWVYLSMAVVIFIIDTSFYLIYPVAPPCRVNSGYIEPIRINLFPLSDSTISVHYSALPSGHIFISMMGLLISYIERWRWPKIIYAFNTVFMSIVIVYTGDHYIEDSIASVALVLVVFLSLFLLFRKVGWIKKEADGRYIST